MKALFTLKSAINQNMVFATIILISSISLVYPELALGASLQTNGQNTANLVFEIKDPNQIQDIVSPDENQNSLAYSTIVKADPLVVDLQSYLEKNNSPLAPYAAQIVQMPRWDDALAISFVESNMCVHQINYNCSGMGGAPGDPTWHKYSNYMDWFKDMTNLLNEPLYAQKYTTFAQMRGVYVQPGSIQWVHGAEKVKSDLVALQQQAQAERAQMIASYQTELATNSSVTLLADTQ